MARIRCIKPQFFEDTAIANLSIEARLLYIGLWCHMDKQGVCEDDAKLIKRNIFPYDDRITVAKIEVLLSEIDNICHLSRVEYSGKRYLVCRTFPKHQRFHKDEKPVYPQEVASAPLQHHFSTTSAPLQHGASSPESGYLNTDILKSEYPSLRSDFDFDALYKKYPRKMGKHQGMLVCKKTINTQADYDALSKAIDRFVELMVSEAREPKHVLYFDSFMRKWRDFADPETGSHSLGVAGGVNWDKVFGE